MSNIFELPETVRDFEFFVLLAGRKGRGRRLTTKAITEQQVLVRGSLIAAHKYNIPEDSFTIKNIAAIGNVSELG